MTWYKLRKTASKSVVSFDFDDTLTLAEWDDENEIFTTKNMNPNLETFDKVKKEAEDGNRIVIVTSRNTPRENEKKDIEEFIDKYKLPISKTDIYYTSGDPKGDILSRLGAKKHYDDCPSEIESALHYNIEGEQIGHPQDKLVNEWTIRDLAIESRGEKFYTEEEARQWVLKEVKEYIPSERDRDIMSKLVPYHKVGDEYKIGLKEIGEITEEDKWVNTEIIRNNDPNLSGVVFTRVSRLLPTKSIEEAEVDTVVNRLLQRPSFFQAITAGQDHKITDGNARYYAAVGLGLTVIPVQWAKNIENQLPLD